jgi:predicted PurR-regulated permease PerM
MRVPRSSTALRVLVIGLGGVLLYFAQTAIIPVVLAVLFALLLSSPVEALHRNGLPRSVSALLILLMFTGVLAATSIVLWTPAQEWLASAPRTFKTIEAKMAPTARLLRRLDAVADSAGRLSDARGKAAPSLAAPGVTDSSQSAFVETRVTVVATVTVIILTLFLLAGGPPVLARMGAAFASDIHATHVLRVIEAVRSEVGRYYATVTLINAGLGLATGISMMALGMPNPFLWAVITTLLNFIPYVGSAVTLILLTLVAFVSFDTVGPVLAVAGTYLVLATIEGQVVQPLLVGQRLELNPIIVFLALWFGGWFWGVAGIVIAVPALVALKVVAQHSERGAPMIEFLSPSLPKGLQALGVVSPAASVLRK